jgi:thioesterase domain-containing protein
MLIGQAYAQPAIEMPSTMNAQPALSTLEPPTPLAALERKLLAMAPVRALGLRLEHYDGALLRLGAPLAPNLNDKGSAFGGSLASLMTLAAWGLTTLKLGEAGFAADVYVQDSQLRYLKPLYADLRIEARLGAGQDWAGFVAAFAQRGKARVQLVAEALDPEGQVVTGFEGRYVALRGG